jgi:hypothetical protein
MLEINKTSCSSVEIHRGKLSPTLFVNTSDVSLPDAICDYPLLSINEIAEKLNEAEQLLRS